jgi:hypothetical protein
MSDSSSNLGLGLADRLQPASSAFGLGVAALFMAFFGFVWFGWGFSAYRAFTDFSSGRTLPAARWVSFYVIFLVLLGLSIQALRLSRPQVVKAGVSDDFRSRFSKQFRVICFFEGTACGVVALLAVTFHRTDLIAAGISLVVGLHFLPLARLFRMKSYYVAGIAIIISDALSVYLFRGQDITLCVGLATGTALWLTALYLLVLSRDFLRQASDHSA